MLLDLHRTPFVARLYAYAHNLPPEPKRFVKFLFVGTFGFVVDFGAFNLIHLFYNVPGVTTDEVITQALSFCAAVTSNFLWNIFWIYPKARSSPVVKKITMFVIVSVLSLFIRTPIFALALPVTTRAVAALGLVQRAPINLGNNLALAAAVVVVMLWNFFVNRYWTYRDVV